MTKSRSTKATKTSKSRVRDLAPHKAADAKGGLKSAADSKGQVQSELARFR